MSARPQYITSCNDCGNSEYEPTWEAYAEAMEAENAELRLQATFNSCQGHDIDGAAAAVIEVLRGQNAELRALLASVEWADVSSEGIAVCPSCDQRGFYTEQPDGTEKLTGHTADCPLAKALSAPVKAER